MDSLDLVVLELTREQSGLTGPIWLSVHVQRPEDVPHYAVWKVYVQVTDGMSYVYMEVLTDSHIWHLQCMSGITVLTILFI